MSLSATLKLAAVTPRPYYHVPIDLPGAFMDKEKARAALLETLRPYRAKSYAELRDLIGANDVYQIESPDGADFQIEIQVFWDHKPDGNIRVSGGTDDGGWSAFAPLSEDFVMTQNGSFQ